MEELFNIKTELESQNEKLKQLIAAEEKMITKKKKFTSDEVVNIKIQLQQIFESVKTSGEKIKQVIQTLPEEQKVFFKDENEIKLILGKQLTVGRVSKIFRQFKDFNDFKTAQETLAPEQAKSTKKSAIRQAFEDYFFFVDDANTYIQGTLAGEGVDQNIIDGFSKWFVGSKSAVKNFLIANSDDEVKEKIKNLNLDSEATLKKTQDYLKTKMKQLVKPVGTKEGERIKQKILQETPIPESVKKLFPDLFVPVEQPEAEKTPDVEEQARQKLEKEKKLYDAFKEYIGTEGVFDTESFNDLLKEEQKAIPALMSELDDFKQKFKEKKTKENAQRYVHIYDQLREKLKVPSASSKEETKSYDKPVEFTKFLNMRYNYSDIKQKANIKELDIGAYQYLLYLYIRYGTEQKIKENQGALNALPGYNLEDYKKLKKAASPYFGTASTGKDLADFQQKLVDLGRSTIIKIIKQLNIVYSSYPFVYTGDITDKTFISNFLRKTSEKPEEPEESEVQTVEENTPTFGNLQQVTTWLWNTPGQERVKFKNIVTKAFKKFKANKYKRSKNRPIQNISEMNPTHSGIDFVGDDGMTFIQFNLEDGSDVKSMLSRLRDENEKPLINYVVKSGNLVDRILKKVFGGDDPMNEKLEQKLKPFIKEVIKGRYG